MPHPWLIPGEEDDDDEAADDGEEPRKRDRVKARRFKQLLARGDLLPKIKFLWEEVPREGHRQVQQ